jgi:hypothetical protein
MRSGAPGGIRTPDPLLRRYALQNSKCRFWCRLRGNASFISLLSWTEVGPKVVLTSLGLRRRARHVTCHRQNVQAALEPATLRLSSGLIFSDCCRACFIGGIHLPAGVEASNFKIFSQVGSVGNSVGAICAANSLKTRTGRVM